MSMMIASNIWKAGANTEEVASLLGITVRSFYRVRQKDPELFPPRDRSFMSSKAVTRACSMWSEGKTIGEISKAVAISKDILGGIMHRNRDMFPKRDKQKRTSNSLRAAFHNAGATNLPKPIAVSHAYDASRLPGVTMIDLDEKRCCRWPLLDTVKGEIQYFCGEAKSGKNYCPAHAQRSVRMVG